MCSSGKYAISLPASPPACEDSYAAALHAVSTFDDERSITLTAVTTREPDAIMGAFFTAWLGANVCRRDSAPERTEMCSSEVPGGESMTR